MLAAALGSLKDAFGNEQRRYAADTLFVPPIVRLEGDLLVWRFGGKARTSFERFDAHMRAPDKPLWHAKRVPVRDGLLRGFVGLANAPDASIVAFARKAGPLGLCEAHGIPCPHTWDENPCEPAGWDGAGGREPIARWRFFAKRARALLLVASRVHQGDYVWTAEEVEGLGAYIGVRKPPRNRGPFPSWEAAAQAINRGTSAKHEPGDTWRGLATAVNDLLDMGGVRVWLVLGPDKDEHPRLVLAPPRAGFSPEFPLLGAVAVQLAMAVPSERGVAFCSACGAAFEPGQQLRPGVRHYCPDCGRRAMWRAASAAARARKRRGVPPRRHRDGPRGRPD